MCTKSFFRRFGAFVAALILCFALSVPALADESLSGKATFRLSSRSSGSASWGSTASNQFTQSVPTSNYSFPKDFGYGVCDVALGRVSLGPALFPAGSECGVYLSFYYSSNASANQSKAPSRSDFSVVLTSSDTGAVSVKPATSLTLFAPNSSRNSNSDGAFVVFRISNPVASPVSSVVLIQGSNYPSVSPTFYFSGEFPNSSNYFYLEIPSFRVVSTASNAELDALEDMASNIAAQNSILSQFYGDIVAVCNQIYNRLGDLQAAQEEANRLFSNVISLLNTTNGKLEAINMAMSTYFELLINQLKQEGIDTRTAIADAEARLELYLKPMIDYFNELEEQTGESASTLPQHKQDIDGFNNDGFGIDSDGQTGLTAILPIFTAFSFILSVLGIFVGLGVLKIIIKKGLS